MVKHTQTIRQEIADELFECVWLICGVGVYKVKDFAKNLFKNIFSKIF